MKREPHFQPPLQQVIYGYTRRMIDETATNLQTFAMVVAEKFLESTAPDVRTVPFRLGDDLGADMRNNAQILRRYMDGTVKTLPANLLDAWVLSLPEPYRSDCERALARRRNLIPVKVGGSGEAAQAFGLAALTGEFAQLLEAIAPALADGQITEADLPYARQILDKSDALIGAVLAVRGRVQGILPGPRAEG